MPQFQTIDVRGVKIRAAVEGEGPLVVLVHGFPESWYSWRHQIGPIAAAGYKVAAIDTRGYGGSDKPQQVAAYRFPKLVDDVVGVIEAFSSDGTATLIGHDWGAPQCWWTAVTRPDRVSAVAGLSVPFGGAPARPVADIVKETYTDKNRFFYQAWFHRVGPSEGEANADPRRFLRTFFYGGSGEAPDGAWPEKPADASLLQGMVDPNPFPAWLTDADIDYYVGEFSKGGFFGPISYYRNSVLDFPWLDSHRGKKITQPSLLIGGDRDPPFYGFGREGVPGPVELMSANASDLRGVHVLPGCGHWTQQERPKEVTGFLLEWLKGL
jgi:pimeloyl-ACP methyl ester carboxylesterase